MKLALFTILTLTTALYSKAPQNDREAILSMAGSFNVTFSFKEAGPVHAGYELKEKAYEANATEIVTIVEDNPEKIALQHLLVVYDKEKKSHVIKHWAQIWTWQDREILDYCGEEQDHEWKKVKLNDAESKGRWSQLVTQIDDTPRYESIGKWIHESDKSVWESQQTRRPLPRREYTKRDDYDYILATNRHIITKEGWRHEQENQKVVDRQNEKQHTLCMERGLNTYTRVDTEHTETALNWWGERKAVWEHVRNFWEQHGEAAGKTFSYTSMKGKTSLNDLLEKLQKDKSDSQSVAKHLEPYLILK